MKLFIFRPKQYGPSTYIVMSENVETARAAVKKDIQEPFREPVDHTRYGGIDSKLQDSDEDMYEVEEYKADQVAENDNA